MKYLIFIFILCMLLFGAGCTNKIVDELIFIITDGVYTMEPLEGNQKYST